MGRKEITTKEDLMKVMPRMSKKRKYELSFYLNDRGRVTYNELCRKWRMFGISMKTQNWSSTIITMMTTQLFVLS